MSDVMVAVVLTVAFIAAFYIGLTWPLRRRK